MKIIKLSASGSSRGSSLSRNGRVPSHLSNDSSQVIICSESSRPNIAMGSILPQPYHYHFAIF